MSQAQNSVVEGEQKPAVHFNVGGQLVSQLGQDVGTLAPDPVPAMPREQGDEGLTVGLIEVKQCCAVHDNQRRIPGGLLHQRGQVADEVTFLDPWLYGDGDVQGGLERSGPIVMLGPYQALQPTSCRRLTRIQWTKVQSDAPGDGGKHSRQWNTDALAVAVTPLWRGERHR
jgi:hypothetical protein